MIAASSASRASVAAAPVSSVRCQPGGGLLSTRCASRKIPAAEAASEKSSGRTSTPRVTRSATSEGRGLVTATSVAGTRLSSARTTRRPNDVFPCVTTIIGAPRAAGPPVFTVRPWRTPLQ